MSEIQKRLNWDVKNISFLQSQGFDYMKYYCGNYSHQKLFTKFRNYLNKYGIPFPFNEACFKHDALYSCKPGIMAKSKIDYMFLKDMIRLLSHKSKKDSKINQFKKRLLVRAVLFYIVVTLGTPIYIIQKKIKY